jgi:hypothetical protein
MIDDHTMVVEEDTVEVVVADTGVVVVTVSPPFSLMKPS